MKRPLFLLLSGFVLGEAAVLMPGWMKVFMTALFLMLFFLCVRNWYQKQGFFCGAVFPLFLFSAACAAGNAVFTGARIRQHSTDCFIGEGRKGQIEGVVKDIRPASGEKTRLFLKEALYRSEEKKLCHVLEKDVLVFLSVHEAEKLLPGDRIEAEGKLESFETPSNPGQFNAKIYYLSKNACCQFYAESSRKEKSEFSIGVLAFFIREKMDKSFDLSFSEEEASFLKAMVLGDKTGLSQEQKSLYEENGMAHLLAISGLHMAAVGGGWFSFFRKRGMGYLTSCFSGGMFLLFYGCVAGFGNSVLRAAIMYLVYLGAQYVGAEYDMISAMGLAGLFMLAECPWRILEGGFQISFLSILAIGLILPWVKELEEKRKGEGKEQVHRNLITKIKEAFRASFVISMTTMPFLLRLFYTWSPYGILLNIIVLPCMYPLMMSGILCGIGGMFCVSAALAAGLPVRVFFRFFEILFELARKLPGAVIVTGYLKVWQICFLYALEGVFLFLWYRRDRRHVIILIVFLMAAVFLRPEKKLRLIMLDVGQGECILLQLPSGENMLIDGGSTSKSKIGQYVIEQALKYYGINQLDYVIVTHTDEDHISGIEYLLSRRYPIRHMVLPALKKPDGVWERICKAAEENGAVICRMAKGDGICMGKAKFICLHPDAGGTSGDKNSDSVVLYLNYGAFDSVFTGDLDEAGEEQICGWLDKMVPDLFPSEIELLKTAHHGSRYSTGENFLQYVMPREAFISSGKNNRYGHPHKETLERLKKAGARVWQTKEGGAIELITDGEEYWIHQNFTKDPCEGKNNMIY